MTDDEPTQPTPTIPPVPDTGHAQVDGVLADLDGLADQPVAEHHDRLARAHEALHGVLSDQSEAADQSEPTDPGQGSA